MFGLGTLQITGTMLQEILKVLLIYKELLNDY